MSIFKLIRRLHRDQQAAAAVEFAIVAGVFFMLMLGMIEFGLIMFSQVIVESAVQEASREVSIGKVDPACKGSSEGERVCTAKNIIEKKTDYLIHPESVSISATVVSKSTDAAPAVPDICLDNPTNPYTSTCSSSYEDNNGNGKYDPKGAMVEGDLGTGSSLVEIRTTYLWRVFFPIMQSKFGKNGVLTITSSTVVNNEPF